MSDGLRRKRSGKANARLADLVAQTYGTTCWLCHQPIVGRVSIDHVTPVSQGGSDDITNLRPAHLKCNVRRGNRRAPTPLLTSTRW